MMNQPCEFGRRLGYITGTVLLFLCTFTLAHGQGISVSPSRMFYSGQPGQTVTQSVTFTNQSKQSMNFVSSIKDWDRDSLGHKRYYPMGNLEASNGAWLSLSESTLQLEPGESRTLQVHMKIPNNASASELSHSMLFFTQIKEQQGKVDKRGLGIRVLLEMGIQIYHVPAGLPAGDLEFVDFQDRGQVSRKTDSVRRVAIKVKNTGAKNQDAYLRFELTNTASGEEIPVSPIPLAMLPGAEQWIYVDLPVNLKGTYLAVAILDAGRQHDLKVAEKELVY